MADRPVPPSRWAERRSNVIASLVVFGVLVVGETIAMGFLAWTIFPDDLVPATAFGVACSVVGWGIKALWKRITRKRRQYQRTG